MKDQSKFGAGWLRSAAVCLVVVVSGQTAHGQLPSKRPPMMSEKTDEAIENGLRFLASRQSADGSFREMGGMGSYPVAMTALAGLSLMASGNTSTQGPYSPQVRKATTFILRSAQRNGLICRAGEEESRSMYGHGFSMLMLAEAMGMEEDPERMSQIRQTLQDGVKIIAQSQSPLGGWLYTPDMNGDEGSVTITQVQALRASRNAGIAVPKKVIDHAMKYLEKSVQPDGGIAYRVGMTGSRPPITAAAVACWFNAGEYDNPLALNALRFCKKNIGIGNSSEGTWGHWYYAHLYLSQVMYLSGEKDWADYYPKMRDRLLATQEPDGSWQGDSVGKVYGTAIALVILQLPLNNLPIMQR
ncbi:MAG: terpene cyclase/mutase family protein [Planctomycetia bacterium]|jgi:hypothetical protein|nr:terpene cyclase/mutase family protein [Planctomycetia bacterium]MCC7316087.1 terpene cyclase/mutase family protein [Planctomycetota bacterium]OQY96805.1 MAG: hypothetical protein B6D36_19255 [Planctomycetes bacterium UTPLA1]